MVGRIGRSFILAAAGAAVLATVLAAGCGGGGSTTSGAVSGLIGPEGGRLEAGGIVVVVPPGAVAAPTEFLIARLSGAQVPPPPNGLSALSAGQFEVNGVMLFAFPVTITFPLSPRLAVPPGQPAPLTVPLWQFFEGAGWDIAGSDVSAPVSALVSANGLTATASVAHFTIYAILADYAPLAVGSSWTYHRTVQVTAPPGGSPGPEETSTVTATITDRQMIGDLNTYVWTEDTTNRKLYLFRTTSAPFELLLAAVDEGAGITELNPPAKLLMLPPAAGQTWQATLPQLDPSAQATVTAETITVGGIEYDAMKVRFEPATAGAGYVEIWFAPGVGPVKWKDVITTAESQTVTELDLQSYTPGGG